MSIQDTLQLFDALRSDNELDRNAAHQTLTQFLSDHQFCLILFQILSAKELNETHHILASSCLLAWYRTNTFSNEEENIILKNIQPFLLIYHPSQKNLFKFYRLFQICYHNEEVITFLANSIGLISLETSPEILFCVLKLSWITIKQYALTIDSSYYPIITTIIQEIYARLQPILVQTAQILQNPLGPTIIRYSFKIIYFSRVKLMIDDQFVSLMFNSFECILSSIQNIENREFYLLVRFCSKILKQFRDYSTQKNSISNIEVFTQMVINFALRFTAVLAPLHLDCIIPFIQLLKLYSDYIPVSSDFFPMLLCISTLTENDLSDFEVNPEVFYEYAYSKNNHNARSLCNSLIRYNKKCTKQFIQMSLFEQPSEPLLYLFSAVIHQVTASKFEDAAVQWIINCYTSQFAQSSILIFSTYLFLVSKFVLILPDNFLIEIFNVVVSIILSSSSIDCSRLNTPSFCQQASQSLVVVINAIRVCNHITKKGIIVAPPQIVGAVIELLPECSTHYASKLLFNILQYSKSDENISGIFQSQKDIIKLNICENILSSLSSALSFDSNQEKKLLEEEYSNIFFYLGLLINILQIEPEPIITEQMCTVIEVLLKNFDEDFGDNLSALMCLICSAGFQLYPQLLSILTESMLTDPYMIKQLNCMYLPIYTFLMKYPESFIELGMAPAICAIGFHSWLNSTSLDSQKIGIDLICYTLQTDVNFDIAPIMQFIEENEVDGMAFILIKMSIIASRPGLITNPEMFIGLIVQWIQLNNAHCTYEKRLAALALLVLCQNDEIMGLAIELLEQEKLQQKEMEKGNIPNCHFLQTPVYRFSVVDYGKQAVQKCSQANQALFLDKLIKICE